MTMMTLTIIALIASTEVAEAFMAPRVSTRSRVGGGASSSTTSLQVFDIANTAAGALDAFFHSQPYAAAFVTCSVKASAADMVVQRKEDEKVAPEPSFDAQRNLGFWLYGGIYQGCVQEYLYNNVFPSVFGDSQTLPIVLEQVALDMVVLTPFLCLPVAYIVKASVASDEDMVDGLMKYFKHVQEEGLLVKYWSLWAPVQCLTFGVVPHHLRIPFIALVSFFWLMILSSISSSENKVTE